MGRAIDANELMWHAYRLGWNEAIDAIIENAPTAVVYCKDCKFWCTEGQYCDRLSGIWEKEYTASNDYCSRGERREDAKIN
jgi:hypothetical protein